MNTKVPTEYEMVLARYFLGFVHRGKFVTLDGDTTLKPSSFSETHEGCTISETQESPAILCVRGEERTIEYIIEGAENWSPLYEVVRKNFINVHTGRPVSFFLKDDNAPEVERATAFIDARIRMERLAAIAGNSDGAREERRRM